MDKKKEWESTKRVVEKASLHIIDLIMKEAGAKGHEVPTSEQLAFLSIVLMYLIPQIMRPALGEGYEIWLLGFQESLLEETKLYKERK